MIDYIEIIDNKLNSITYDVDAPDGGEVNVINYALLEILRDLRNEEITLLAIKIYRKGDNYYEL